MKAFACIWILVVATTVPAIAQAPPEPPARAESEFSAISSRLSVGDTIYVWRGGDKPYKRTKGTFCGVSQSAVMVNVGGQVQSIPGDDVAGIWRRGERQAKRGMLYGSAAGAAIATAVMLANSPNNSPEFSTGATIVVGVIAGSGMGLVSGAAFGALIHGKEQVYRAPRHAIQVTPTITPGQARLAVSIGF